MIRIIFRMESWKLKLGLFSAVAKQTDELSFRSSRKFETQVGVNPKSHVGKKTQNQDIQNQSIK